jgi:N-acetylglucosamine kinase-like BadF-type ATPase
MSDGRLPKGPLHTLVGEALNLTHDLDLCAHVNGIGATARSELARLSLVVTKAAEAGDHAALDVFRRAGRELARIADALRIKLGYDADEPVRLSYSGGAFSAGDVLLTPFKEALTASSPAFVLCRPLYDPHYGAALYAAKVQSIHTFR